MKNWMIVVFLARMTVIFLAIMVACDSNNNDDLADKQKRLAELQTSIDSLIADKSCNGVGDCATMAFGSKPCGGPWSYLIYAPSTVDETILQQMVGEYNQLQAEINALTKAVSDCALVGEPDLGCEDNQCKAI